MIYQHPKMRYTYVGADNHKYSHTFVFMNFLSEKLGELVVSNTPSDFEGFIKEAQKYKQPETELIFGFEDVTHYGRTLAGFLISKGYTVKHVNANLVAQTRNASNVIQKTDFIDALSVARVLINRFDDLPHARPHEAHFIMGLLVSKRQAFSKQKRKLKSTLHSLLFPQYPNYHTFFSNLDAKSALAFYEQFPSPHTLVGISVEELTTFFSQIVYKKLAKQKATLILDSVQSAGVIKSDFQGSIDYTIRLTVKELKTAMLHLAEIEDKLTNLLPHFNYPLTSMKGIDDLTACRLIAEIGDVGRFKNAKALAQYAGIAPVVHSSGNRDIKHANKRGNRQLNSIIHNITLVLISPSGGQVLNPFFYHYYRKKISEGKTKKQAMKVVSRRLINIIYGIMKHGENYINPPVGYLDEKTGELITDELNDNQLTHIEKRLATFKS